MGFEHPGYTVSFAKACGCAPPRTFPDLVKKLKARSAGSYFWVSPVVRRSTPVWILENCFVLNLEPSKMNPRCARCSKTVYPMEKLNCLDKVQCRVPCWE